MRLVQRHGRVDRIGSPHSEVYLRTFFPDRQLDALLNLEGRVRRKLAQAAMSVGVEDAPIELGAEADRSFADDRAQIEKLRREDASLYEAGGTEGAAQTGEEYRQELRQALARHGSQIEKLPWRIGSGLVRGHEPGHVFCAIVGERIYLRFVPIAEGEPITAEIGTCLKLIECNEDTPAVLSAEMASRAYAAWERARGSIFDAWTHETDPANLQPQVRRLNREVAQFLRTHPHPDIDQQRLQRCLDAVEAPWPQREEKEIRATWKRDFTSSAEKSLRLVELLAQGLRWSARWWRRQGRIRTPNPQPEAAATPPTAAEAARRSRSGWPRSACFRCPGRAHTP